MTRASQDWETPPEPNDVHPWSEELQELLESHSVQAELADFVVDKFDRDLCRDQIVILSSEDLLKVASLCSEISSSHTIFWNNTAHKMQSAQGSSLIETMEKVANVIYNQELSERGDEAIEALLDAGLPDSCVDAAAEIFMRIKKIHMHKLPTETAPPTAIPDGMVVVPQSALDWLNGEVDFFVCPEDLYFRGKPATYWWRTEFRRRIAAAPGSAEGES